MWGKLMKDVFFFYFLVLAHWHEVGDEGDDRRWTVAEELVLEGGDPGVEVVGEVEVVTTGGVPGDDGGGDQQDGGRGLPATCFLSHFHIFTIVQVSVGKIDLKKSWFEKSWIRKPRVGWKTYILRNVCPCQKF